MALSDLTSGLNHAHREGVKEGIEKGIAEGIKKGEAGRIGRRVTEGEERNSPQSKSIGNTR